MFWGLLFVLFLSVIVLSVLWFTTTDYPFGIFKLLLWCDMNPDVKLLCWDINCQGKLYLVWKSNNEKNACPSLAYGFWLPLWYLQTFVMMRLEPRCKIIMLRQLFSRENVLSVKIEPGQQYQYIVYMYYYYLQPLSGAVVAVFVW
jgi:hypothetical protein